MPLTTPQNLITLTLKAAGILSVGQSALPEDYADVFDALNAMLAQWNRRRWLVYHLIDVSKLSTGAQSYTVGPGGDFDTTRTDRLESAFFRQFVNSTPNQVDFQLTVLQSREDYNQIALKSLASTLPRLIFFDSDYPIGRVYPWPIPAAGLGEIHLSLKDVLPQFTSFVAPINLPPEYLEALWTNLAIRVVSLYPGANLPDNTVALAKSSLATVRGANAQIPALRMPRYLRGKGYYDARSDSWA